MKLIHGDCLEKHKDIKGGSVDLIVVDPPYGMMKGIDKNNNDYSNHDWDIEIEPKKFFEILSYLLRKNGKAVVFSQEKYTSKLIQNTWYSMLFNNKAAWVKNHFANGMYADKTLVSYYEDIIVFSKKHDTERLHPLRDYFSSVLNFIGLSYKNIAQELGHRRAEHTFYTDLIQFALCTEATYKELIEKYHINKMEGFKLYDDLKAIDVEFCKTIFNLWEGNNHKGNLFVYQKESEKYHPTQKPILLLEDLIKTYSNEDDLVCDFTMGSGSTAIACMNTNRKFIGIEKNKEYFEIACKRVNDWRKEMDGWII